MSLKPSREIAFPFRIGPNGGIATVEDPYKTYFQHLVVVIMTGLGERVMLPDFGSPTRSYLFENVDDVVGTELSLLIQEAVRVWEPAVVLHDIQPRTDRNHEGELLLEITFSVPPNEDVRTTVVDVSGAVPGGA